MIVFLLLIIIAILLFGSAAVLDVAGLIIMAVILAVAGVLFWSAGWTGLMWLGIIILAMGAVFGIAELQRRQDTAERWKSAMAASKKAKEAEDGRSA